MYMCIYMAGDNEGGSFLQVRGNILSCPAVSHSDNFMCFWGISTSLRRGWGSPSGAVAVVEEEGRDDVDDVVAALLLLSFSLLLLAAKAAKVALLPALLCGGPTGTMRDPNSTPMVTSCCALNRPSHSRIVSDDLPHPESPMHTSLAM